jgi:hypothetical protein
MTRFGMRPAVFMVVYCCAYAFVFAKDLPLFRYYPLHRDFSWGSGVLSGIGPAMAWYGLMASAALFAGVAAVCMPGSLTARFSGKFLWVFPVGTMLISIFLLRRFLF